jgi:hypothetical protein
MIEEPSLFQVLEKLDSKNKKVIHLHVDEMDG